MIIHVSALALAAAAGAAALWKKDLSREEKYLCFWVYFLPFLSGGLTPFSWAATIGVLLVFLWLCGKQNGHLKVLCNDTFLALLLLTVASGVSVFWAIDRGTALWGIVRYVPVLLFALALLQLPGDRKQRVWLPVPLSGVVMTALSAILQYIPGMELQYTVAGRLAGFFEYPNTFAAFLLTGLVISVTAERRSKWSWAADAVLIYGVFDSGSRTAFLLMILVLVLIVLQKKEKRFLLGLAAVTALCAALVLILSLLGLDHSVGRFLDISLNASTMLGRFLYFKDALAVILRHPLGLGYMGYRALQGSFQTGVYSVAYVHNGFLQLFLDVGWVPALAVIYVFIRGFFQKQSTIAGRMVMVVLLIHSMMDFDLEFLPVWLVLLPALQLEGGAAFRIRPGKLLALGSLLGCLCLWLAAGDASFRAGQMELALQITPFHTQALEYRLTQIRDAEELDRNADLLLRLNGSSSLGHSAKANAAFAAGDFAAMVTEKKAAISCARYSLTEYCDYFRKLCECLAWYRSQGDTKGAEVCVSLLLEIPRMLEQVRQETDPLAWKLDDTPQLELPPEYQKFLAELASLYTAPANQEGGNK